MTFLGHFKEQILPERLSRSTSFICRWHVETARRYRAKYCLHYRPFGHKPRVMAMTVGEDFGDYRQWPDAKGGYIFDGCSRFSPPSRSLRQQSGISAQIAFYPKVRRHTLLHNLQGFREEASRHCLPVRRMR